MVSADHRTLYSGGVDFKVCENQEHESYKINGFYLALFSTKMGYDQNRNSSNYFMNNRLYFDL